MHKYLCTLTVFTYRSLFDKLSPIILMYVCMCMCVYVYIYMCMFAQDECVCVCVYIYIYIYIYIYMNVGITLYSTNIHTYIIHHRGTAACPG